VTKFSEDQVTGSARLGRGGSDRLASRIDAATLLPGAAISAGTAGPRAWPGSSNGREERGSTGDGPVWSRPLDSISADTWRQWV
jgi:hypothetical protein